MTTRVHLDSLPGSPNDLLASFPGKGLALHGATHALSAALRVTRRTDKVHTVHLVPMPDWFEPRMCARTGAHAGHQSTYAREWVVVAESREGAVLWAVCTSCAHALGSEHS